MYTPDEHAKLSPSASKRWLRCPGSVELNKDLPDKSGKAAIEGTMAHEALAALFSKDSGPFANLPTEEMREAVMMAYSQAMDFREHVFAVEHRVDITRDCWGTADLIMWNLDTSTLRIVDLKYGLMSVEAEGNPQLQIYALGAVKWFHDMGLRPKRILGTILQPRLDPSIREAEYPVADLFRMETKIGGVTDALTDGSAALEAGDHCTWCPALPTCPAYREHHQREAAVAFDVVSNAKLDDVDSIEDVATRLRALQQQEPWVKAAKAMIKHALQEGREVPGYALDGRGFMVRRK